MSTLDEFFLKYKKTRYQLIKEDLELHLTNTEIKEICADNLHYLYPNGGDGRINGIVLLNLEKEGKLRKKHMIRSERKECHHRPIMLYEVVHGNPD
jgi:hypothetical protein